MPLDPRRFAASKETRAFVDAIAANPGCQVYVVDSKERTGMRRLLKRWRRMGWIKQLPNVWVDAGLEDGLPEVRA